MKRLPFSRPPRHRRDAFTLLELLMVIGIIGILTSLLVVGVTAALRRARIVEVSAEITQFDQALASFKTQFGIEPPSNLLIPAVGGTWDTKSRAAVRAIWPLFNFATNGGLGNGTTVHLNGAECLVFFLGGIQSGTPGAGVVSGFSKNPRTPWIAPTGNADGPFFEFDSGRLVDVDGDSAFEYVDTLSDQETPYLYLTGQGKHYNRENDLSAPDDYDVFGGPSGFGDINRDMLVCYRKEDWDSPQRSESYQIISPGEDGRYGPGGLYTDGSELPERDLDTSGSIDPYEVRDPEDDNITNFSEGLLKP